MDFGVSVVIPTYNRKNFLERSISSVLRQGYSTCEILVVDNGSTDGTVEWLSEVQLTHTSLRVISAPERQGAQYARNRGILASQFSWVAFLDSDDEWLEGKLRYQMDLIKSQQSELVFIHTNILAGDDNSGTLRFFPISKIHGDHAFSSLLFSTGPSFPTFLTSKKALEKIGLLDESVVAYQEWDTSIRLAEICNVLFQPLPTAVWWRHDKGSISDSNQNAAKGYLYILEKHWNKIVAITGTRGIEHHKSFFLKNFNMHLNT